MFTRLSSPVGLRVITASSPIAVTLPVLVILLNVPIPVTVGSIMFSVQIGSVSESPNAIVAGALSGIVQVTFPSNCPCASLPVFSVKPSFDTCFNPWS